MSKLVNNIRVNKYIKKHKKLFEEHKAKGWSDEELYGLFLHEVDKISFNKKLAAEQKEVMLYSLLESADKEKVVPYEKLHEKIELSMEDVSKMEDFIPLTPEQEEVMLKGLKKLTHINKIINGTENKENSVKPEELVHYIAFDRKEK